MITKRDTNTDMLNDIVINEVKVKDDEGNNRMSFLELSFVIVLLVASAFSAYSTYKGFLADIPDGAFVFSFIVFVGLIMSNFSIKNAYVNNVNIKKPIMLFVFFLFISVISNTNAFYSHFIKKDIVEQTQINAWKDFDKGCEILLQKLNNDKSILEYNRKKSELDIEVKNLVEQITDPNNPGMGVEAVVHWNNIESLLGVTLVRLNPPEGMDNLRNYANELKRIINEQYENSLPVNVRILYNLRKEINTSLKNHHSKILTHQWNKNETDFMKDDLERFKAQTEELVHENIELPSINNTADDIGHIDYTFNNFINGINKASMMVSILFALILDLIPVMISLSLFKKE